MSFLASQRGARVFLAGVHHCLSKRLGIHAKPNIFNTRIELARGERLIGVVAHPTRPLRSTRLNELLRGPRSAIQWFMYAIRPGADVPVTPAGLPVLTPSRHSGDLEPHPVQSANCHKNVQIPT